MGIQKVPLPKVVAVKVPRETSVPGLGVPVLDVATLVGMLERGEVSAAVAAARHLTGTDLRLAMLAELLGVAEQLPLSITIAIAQSISIMEMEKARAALVAYRVEYPREAHKVSRVLAKHAPALSAQLGQIYVPGIYSRPTRHAARAGSRLGIGASLVLMGIAGSRCASLNHHYDYATPAFQPINDFKMPLHLDPALFELSKPTTSFSDIARSAGEIVRDGTPSQVLAARDIRNAALANDCGQLIDAVSALGESEEPAVARSIAEITVRLDLVCPSR